MFIYTVTFIPHIIIGGWLSKPIKLSVRCSDAPRSSARCYGCYGKATPLLMQVIIIYVSILGNICHKQSIFHPCSYIGYVQLGFMDIFRYSSTILLSWFIDTMDCSYWYLLIIFPFIVWWLLPCIVATDCVPIEGESSVWELTPLILLRPITPSCESGMVTQESWTHVQSYTNIEL